MDIAHNPQTNEVFGLRDGKWEKLPSAVGDKGELYYLDGGGWQTMSGASTPPKAQAPDEPSAMHSMGVGLRGALSGALDTLAAPGAALMNAGAQAVGSDWRYTGAGNAWADALGLPQPSNSAETAAMRFNEGAVGMIPAYLTGGAMKAAGPVASAVGATLQEQPLMQAGMGGVSAVSSGVAADAGAGPFGQMAAGVAAPVLAGGLLGLAPGTHVNLDRAAAFKRATGGEVPSLGVVSDGGFAPMVEAALAKHPVSAKTMGNAWERTQDALRNSVSDAASKVAGGQIYPQTQNELGQAILDGVASARQRASQAYSQAWDANLAPYEQLDVPLNNTMALFQAKAERRTPQAVSAAGANADGVVPIGHAGEDVWKSAERMLGGTLKDAQDYGGASLGAVKDKRSVLNERIREGNAAKNMDITSADAAQVSATLRDDLFASLREKAPTVASELERMDGEYAKWAQKAERIDKRMTGNGREPEQVAKKTAPDALTLGDVIRLRETLSPTEWRRIMGGIMNELPRSSQGDVSGAAFATKMGSGSKAYRPEVQRQLFGNELDDARKIAAGMNNVSRYVNNSNTATAVNTLNVLSGLGGLSAVAAGRPLEAAVSAATGIGIPYVSSMFTTSPMVTRAVTSPDYQAALQSALRARAPMIARGLMSPVEQQ